jgi:SAM-dependent methyltransferase
VGLHLHSENIKDVPAPAILIAGCGTGQHSIRAASRFSDCQVTAVDLSLASLAYAKRKTAELGITNLRYLQADILNLNNLEQDFDVIESAGVLHHMDEPMAGWRVLRDMLKPGGLMKIGLYSELARQQIVKIKDEIVFLNVGTSRAEIRNFRKSLMASEIKGHQQITSFADFFSLSAVRDLIFHVQEHRFTLPKIKKCLDELKLEFCGFEDKNAISNFRELHGEQANIYDLVLWHQYEESNPSAFVGMYQFWCQKI